MTKLQGPYRKLLSASTHELYKVIKPVKAQPVWLCVNTGYRQVLLFRHFFSQYCYFHSIISSSENSRLSYL